MKRLGTKNSPQKWGAGLPLLVGWLALFLLVGGIGVWSVTTVLSGAIIAGGQIEVEQSRQIVQHPVGGVVKEILVHEGDLVEAGQVLIRLDPTNLDSELTVIEGQYYELLARRGALEAERDDLPDIEFDPELLQARQNNPTIESMIQGQQRLFAARRNSQQQESGQLVERKAQIAAQIDGFDAQLSALNAQLDLIGQELGDQKKLLDKGLAQSSRILALQREVARMQGQRGEVLAAKAEAGGRMIENDIGILRLVSSRREEAISRIRDLNYQENELAERRRLAKENLSRLDIRSPSSGAVYGMQVHALLSVIRPADPLMYIVPKDRPLVVAARIEPIHVDQVYVGQPVTLHFSAFDQRTTPELEGRVVKLSADAFVDQATRVTYYQAEIAPLPGELEKLNTLKVLPGMPVEAFIRTADRTPFSYLTKPVADYFKKAFRED